MVLCFALAAVVFGRVLLRRGLSVRSTIATVLFFALSYPLLLDMQQGNCEWIVWVVLTGGLLGFVTERPAIAATLLGLAAAIKLYPIILFGLFFTRRQYRWIGVGVASCVLASVGSMWLESGSIALSWAGTLDGLIDLHRGFVFHYMHFWDHSLFEFFKAAISLWHPRALTPAASQNLERIYLLVMGIGGLILFFTRIRQMPLLNQILALCTACVLLPPMSMDYTIIQLFLPCALLILAALRHANSGSGASIPGLRAALLLMACLFAPTTELTLYGHTISSAVHTIALIALFVISVRYPFEAANLVIQQQPGDVVEPALAA